MLTETAEKDKFPALEQDDTQHGSRSVTATHYGVSTNGMDKQPGRFNTLRTAFITCKEVWNAWHKTGYLEMLHFFLQRKPRWKCECWEGEASTLQCLQVAWWGTCSRCTYLQKEVLRMPRSVVLPDSHRMVHLLAHWVPQMRVTRKSPRGLLVQRTNVNEETKHFQRELFKEGVQLPMCKGWGGARLVPQTSQLCPERVGKSKPATRTEMLLKACVDGSYQLDTLHLHFIGFNGSFWPILHCKKF